MGAESNTYPETPTKPLYRIGWNLSMAVFDSLFRIENYENHHVPERGPFLLAANHISYLDPPAIGVSFRRPIHYFARDTLFRGPADRILRGVNAVPVNNRGGSDLTAMRRALDVLKEGEGLLVFPEGTRSPDGNFLEPRRGIGLLACKGGVPVLPARLFGTFEALGRGRKPRFGVPLRIRFGPLLQPEEFDPGRSAKDRFDQAAEKIMASIRRIKDPFPPVAI
ncbi:MAG: lysophospholipid acyltransferase family protein [Verrucomicrobiota bacterium]